MGPGFIRGIIVGAAASALGLSALSLSVPLPQSPEAKTEAPKGGQTPPVPQQDTPIKGAGRDADLVEAPPVPPETTDQGSAQQAAVGASVTDPGEMPKVGQASGDLTAPAETTDPSNVQVDTAGDLGQGIATPPATPQTPADETELSISTVPAQPQAPEVSVAVDLAPAPDSDATPVVQTALDPSVSTGQGTGVTAPTGGQGAAPSDASQSAAQPQVGGSTGLGTPPVASGTTDDFARPATSSDPTITSDGTTEIAAPATGDAPAQVPTGAPAPQIASDSTGLPSPDASTESVGVRASQADTSAPVIAAAPGGIAAPGTAPAASTGSETTESAAQPQVGSPTASLGTPTAPASPSIDVGQDAPVTPGQSGTAPVTASTETAPDVSTDPAEPVSAPDAPRLAALPQIGVERTPSTLGIAATVPGTTTDADIAPAEPATPDSSGLPPIEANAEPFEDPQGRPLMSIILIDEPGSIGADALADFPYPLTFALDPTAPDAETKMRAHRAVGFEVVSLIDLPLDARPTDAEVSMSVWLERLNQSVAVLEGTGSGLQGNRPLSDQVTDIVRQSGLGLITLDNGLNTVQKLAAREGVPSTIVFRDFDGAGQTPTVMRRFLDQAAFRAGQQGSVVMLGRLRPDTVSALLLWGLQDRASRVALAPISAVLTDNTE